MAREKSVTVDSAASGKRAARKASGGRKATARRAVRKDGTVSNEPTISEARDYAEAIVRTTRDPLLILDADLCVHTANEAFYSLFKVGAEESEGRSVYDLGNRQWDIPRLRELLEDILPRRSFFNDFEVTLDFENLGPRTMLLNARRLSDTIGQPARILLGIQDVSELLQFQAELERSEQRYRRLFEAARDGVLIIDPNTHKTLDANPFMTELLGYTRKELLGKELFEIGLLKDEDASRAAFRELQVKGFIRYDDLPLETRTGERREVEFVSNLYQEGDEQIVQCNIRDITERKRVEEALRESEEGYRTLFAAVPMALFVCDRNAVIQHYNQRAAELWGRKPACGVEQHCGSVKLWLPDGSVLPHAQSPMVEVLRTGIPALNVEVFIERPDGSRLPVLVNFAALKDARGEVTGAITSFEDITERKHAEEERERLLAREHESRQEAEDANRTKDEFLATVSHELRTPLNAILGWADMLIRGKLDEDTAARGLETIARNARAQNQLISDLLDVSRIITGQLRFETGVVELTRIIDAAADTVRPAAQAKGVELRLMLDPAAGLVSGDAARLQQIVWNLLTNAVKFTSRDGHVDVQLRREGPSVVISVSDTGEGLSPEFLPYIFNRFRQAEGTTTRQHGGLGLGLAIVRHLVEAHGGTVRAASQGVGQGSTFTVALPLLAVRGEGSDAETAVAGEVPANRSPALLILQGLRVQVVDDEQDARELLTIVLKQRGAEVRASATAREAFEMLKQWKPDVLVSDIGMPGEDGYELIRKVRTLRSGSRLIPALALTGYASPEDAARALESGYHMHLPKPVAPGELVAAVASLAMKTLQA